MDVDTVWRHTHEQRRALAAILADLTPAEWSTPSLCEGWTVRHVAAHVIASPAARIREFLPELVRQRLSYHRAVDADARRRAEQPTDAIVAAYTTYDGSRRRPPIPSTVPLMDVLVHTQDIVVPLGRSHPMPIEAARVAARTAHRAGRFFPGGRARRGVTIRATDTDFSVGRGPVVEGPIDAVLLLLTGRTATAVPRLTGPGVGHLS
jgi:uncharacterized protein (TIGR03083 family)